jgi:Fur family ferric uptake transcriptional regulator
MQKKTYKTCGREALTAFLSQHPDRQFTAEELCQAVNGSTESGKSSIYRLLGELCAEETVHKFRDEERKCAVYQYIGKKCDCRTHFHEQCTRCGVIRHLECDDSVRFAAHLLTAHGFSVDCGRSILYGICADCRRAEGRA